MNFIYDDKIDKECIESLRACDTIFGEKKKTGSFPVSDEIVKKFTKMWTKEVEDKFCSGMYQIFGTKIPDDFKCYINSTPYSMDIKEGISVSASARSPIQTICHEMNHFMFRKSDYVVKYFPKRDIEEAKEIFTIINNMYFQDIMEGQDIGWKKFWKERFNFFAVWLKSH